VSVIGTDKEREDTLAALNQAAGFIGVHASKEVVIRYFPQLLFKLDDSAEKHQRIEELLHEIKAQQDHGDLEVESSDG
jgi:ribosome-binding factor A